MNFKKEYFSGKNENALSSAIENLSYNNMPLFLLLEKSCEVFIEQNDRIIPLDLFYPGDLLGVFEIIDLLCGIPRSTSTWGVSSGIRTILCLPKINEEGRFRKLGAAYGVPQEYQKNNITKQWEIFKTIAGDSGFSEDWDCEILFFTEPWLRHLKNDPAWEPFRRYIFEFGWKKARTLLAQGSLSLQWEGIVRALDERNLKLRPYIADQVRHILYIIHGRFPAFRPIEDLTAYAPIIGFQKVLTDLYRVKDYIPTFMRISSVDEINEKPLYYSLSFPTVLEGLTEDKANTTIMQDMREIKHLFDVLHRKIFNKKDELKNIELEYFHVEKDIFNEVKQSIDIPLLDDAFSFQQSEFKDRIFCSKSRFFRGCIRIKKVKP